MKNEVAIYPGEILIGQVIAINRRAVWLGVYGRRLPLDGSLLTWQTIRHPAEIVSMGERISVMVEDYSMLDQWSKHRQISSDCMIGKLWLSRLPLQDNP